jgi:hypothetical protein
MMPVDVGKVVIDGFPVSAMRVEVEPGSDDCTIFSMGDYRSCF